MTILEWLWMLEELSYEEKSSFALFCQERHLSKWEILFNEWDEANAVYFLKEWEISIYKNLSWWQVKLWKIVAEDILWEMAIFGGTWKRIATAKAVEDCVLIIILSFSIKELTQKHPDIMIKIQNIIEKRIYENKMLEWKISNA